MKSSLLNDLFLTNSLYLEKEKKADNISGYRQEAVTWTYLYIMNPKLSLNLITGLQVLVMEKRRLARRWFFFQGVEVSTAKICKN